MKNLSFIFQVTIYQLDLKGRQSYRLNVYIFWFPFVANECFGMMCCFLKDQFSSCCDMTVMFAVEQLERKLLTFGHIKSVLSFIRQVSLSWIFPDKVRWGMLVKGNAAC